MEKIQHISTTKIQENTTQNNGKDSTHQYYKNPGKPDYTVPGAYRPVRVMLTWLDTVTVTQYIYVPVSQVKSLVSYFGLQVCSTYCTQYSFLLRTSGSHSIRLWAPASRLHYDVFRISCSTLRALPAKSCQLLLATSLDLSPRFREHWVSSSRAIAVRILRTCQLISWLRLSALYWRSPSSVNITCFIPPRLHVVLYRTPRLGAFWVSRQRCSSSFISESNSHFAHFVFNSDFLRNDPDSSSANKSTVFRHVLVLSATCTTFLPLRASHQRRFYILESISIQFALSTYTSIFTPTNDSLML